jgi:hypothetical protein
MSTKKDEGLGGILRGGIIAAVVVLLGSAALAQDPVERAGYFEVRSASTELINGVHMLDARLQLVLSSELQMQVIRSRRFYLDALDAELAFRFELEYRPISQRYIVRNLNSGDQDSFATLYSALNTLGRIQRLPVIDESLLIPDRAYRVRLRALLATEQYSAPLRLLFFWRDEWQLKSEWYEWKLER